MGPVISLLATALLGALGQGVPQTDQLPRAETASGFQSLENGLRYRVVQLVGSRHECLALVFRIGQDRDPQGQTGLAEVVGAALRLAQQGEAERERFHVVVKGAFTQLWTTAPVTEVDRRMEFLGRLLGGTLALDDDLLARAIAIAVLQADNEAMIFPGPVLRQRAKRALLAGLPQGRQSAGIPAEIQNLTPERVRERLGSSYRPGHGILVALGGMDEADLAEHIAALAALPPGELDTPPDAVHDPLSPPEAVTTSSRVDAPFVSAALRAPLHSSPDFLPFLLALEVLRARAGLAFRTYRGGESLARFHFVEHNYMDGDRLALVNRRGENNDSLEDVEAEVAQFLLVLRDNEPTQRDVKAAALAVSLRVSLPPYDARLLLPMLEQPDLLMPRALALGMYELWGWPTDLRAAIEAVPLAAVRQAIADHFAPENVHWFALVPGD